MISFFKMRKLQRSTVTRESGIPPSAFLRNLPQRLKIFSVYSILAVCGVSQEAAALSCDDLKDESKKIYEEISELVMRSGSLSDAEMCRLFRDTDIPRSKGHIKALEYFATCPGVGLDAKQMLATEKVALKNNEERASDYCAKAGIK